MGSDKRSVTTDALETLGSIISENEKRDAIHLAVDPAIAAHPLSPGDDVGFVEGGVGVCDNPVGIVDPFLKAKVRKGERFWLVLYPRTITSLRHVWAHPAFPEIEVPDLRSTVAVDPKAASKKWIEDFAGSIDQTVNSLMRAAEKWIIDSDYTYDNSESYKGHWGEFQEFWKHYEVVTGKSLDGVEKESFFNCSC